MRRVIVLLAALCLLLAGLTACGVGDDATQAGEATVSGGFGDEPKVKTSGDFAPAKLQTNVVSAGKGTELEMGDGVFARLYIYNAYDEEAALSSWETGQKEFLELGEALPGLSEALVGKKIGSRVVIEASAREIFGEYGQPNLFISAEDPLVIVADIVSRTLPEVTSDPADQKPGQPKLTFKDDRPTGFDFSTAPKKGPAKAQLVTLTKGDGEKLTKESTLVMRYLGQVWGGEKPFDENYTGSPSPTPIANLVPGFADLLPGVTVGSRVLLILPPASGYGSKGNEEAGIKGTDTLVFVVDVLGADEPSGTTDKPTKEAAGDQE